MGTPNYTKVTGQIGAQVRDGADAGTGPDVAWAVAGTIRLTPIHGLTKWDDPGQPAGPFNPKLLAQPSFDAVIGADGKLSWNGEDSIDVVDFSDPYLTPHVDDLEATHWVDFIGVRSDGGVAISVDRYPVRLTGASANLIALSPTVVGPGVIITKGDTGEPGSNFIPTDEFVAGRIADPASDTAGALSAKINDEVAVRVPLEIAADGTVAAAAAAAADDAVDAYLGVPPGELLSYSTNLFIADTATEGVAYTSGGSSPVASGLNGVSDYFAVIAGETYVFGGGPARVTWFNAAKTYISDSGGLSGGSTRVPPAGATFARVTLPITSFAIGQVNKGATLLTYQRGYSARISDTRVPAVADLAPSQTVFFDPSLNLFDKQTVTLGVVLSAGAGTPTANPSYVVSDWIHVESVTDYTYSGDVLRVTYYDEARTRINDFSFATYPTTKITPPRTRWVRLSVILPYLNTAQMVKGVTALSYRPGGNTLRKHLTPGRRPVIDADLSGVFDANVTIPDMSATIPTSTSGDVHAAYDALVTAHPDYVTRTLIGNEASVDALPIYRYDFIPPKPLNTSNIGSPTPTPKVILVAGTHGNEKASVWSTFHLCENLCDAWGANPILAALRYNVHLIVVPVANPSGYRDNTRPNANGVDPARNWPTMWTQGTSGTSTYGGSAPLSEPETLAVKTVLDGNADALLVLDYHNFHSPANNYDFLYGTPGNSRTAEVISAVVRRMDRKWKADEPTIVDQDPNTFIGNVSPVPGGSLGIEAVDRGHAGGMTFEQCWKVPTEPGAPTYSSLAMTWGYEALVNVVCLSLVNL